MCECELVRECVHPQTPLHPPFLISLDCVIPPLCLASPPFAAAPENTPCARIREGPCTWKGVGGWGGEHALLRVRRWEGTKGRRKGACVLERNDDENRTNESKTELVGLLGEEGGSEIGNQVLLPLCLLTHAP